MDMKAHILAGMREKLNEWEELLASLSEEQIHAPLLPSEWSVKDVIVHLWAWQWRSYARMSAALDGKEPNFPYWLPGHDPEAEANTDQVNAWIYETYRHQSWSMVYQDWRDGYLRLLESAEAIPERDLLDAGKYPWLEGHSLAFVLVASYDHHQENYEKLLGWLEEQGSRS